MSRADYCVVVYSSHATRIGDRYREGCDPESLEIVLLFDTPRLLRRPMVRFGTV
jgi:hypothetical protein